ncbi:MAG: DUF6488 family protein [Thermodesulfobacteriota bacterium]
MRILKIMLFIIISSFAFNAVCPVKSSAHSDAEHLSDAIEEYEAVAAALKYVKQLVEKGKIEKSWEAIEHGTGKIKKFGRKYEWVVTLKNSQVKDPTKRTLYFFLTLKGEYIAANFTGK